MALSNEVLANACFWLYCSEYGDEFEQRGGNFGPGAALENEIERLDDEKYIPLIQEYVDRLAKAWGLEVDWVFNIMEIPEDKYDDALYSCLMACRGHGIGLEDRYQKNIDIFEKKMRRELDTSPIHTELDAIRDLAWDNLETPDKEYGVFERDTNDLIMGKFWSLEAAKQMISDCSAYEGSIAKRVKHVKVKK